MAEEDGINRMVDSLVLFDDMINHPLLEKKSFVLFLNKRDLYDKKIKKKDIIDYFPQYKGLAKVLIIWNRKER
jgi:guanine nucleotide-binding protein G(i) subunit alpha